jgi:hypothetical protein
MTVNELIEQLQIYPPDASICAVAEDGEQSIIRQTYNYIDEPETVYLDLEAIGVNNLDGIRAD